MPDSAIEHLARSIAPDSAVTNLVDEARARRELGNLLVARGQFDSALTILRGARTLLARSSERTARGGLLRDLGLAFDKAGQVDSAVVSLRESAALLREARDSANVVTSAGWLGAIESRRGNAAAAIEAYREALAWQKPDGDERARRTFHGQMALAFEKLGQKDSMLVHARLSSETVSSAAAPDSVIAADRRELARTRTARDAKGERLAIAQLASHFSKFGPSDSAETWYRRSLTVSREARDSMPMAVAMLSLGLIAADRHANDSARTQLRDAAATLRALGHEALSLTPLMRAALTYREEGQVDSAIANARGVLAAWRRLGNRAEEATATMMVAGLYLQRLRYDSALSITATTLASLPGGTDPRTVALLYGVRGVAFSGSGHYDSAVVNIKRTVPLWQQAGDLDKRAQALGQVGSIYRQLGQFDSAMTYHREQRRVADALRSTELQHTATRLLAQDFEAAGARDSALKLFREQQGQSARAGDAAGEAEALERIGQLLLQLGDADSAAVAFRRALTLARATLAMRLQPSGLATLAELFDRAGEADSALTTYQTAQVLGSVMGDRATETLALSSIARLQRDRGRAAEGLAALREALAIERATGSLERSAALFGNIGHHLRLMPKPDLAGAAAAFDTAAAYRAAVRQDAGADENRVSIGTRSAYLAGEWELTWIARARTVGAEVAALSSLAASERSRAQALLDLMRGTTPTSASGASLAMEGRRLVKAATASGAVLISYLVTEDTLITWIARPGVPLSVRVVALSADTLGAMIARWRRALGADGAVAPGGRGVESEPPPGSAADPATATALGATLARVLLPEALRSARGTGELVIVPHGALALVPFGALPMGGPGETLANRFALRYAPSLASLAEVERAPTLAAGSSRRAALTRALVVGNPAMPAVRATSGEMVTLPQLPASAREAQAVAAQVGTTMLTGRAAGEGDVRRRMTEAPLIHLATHGYAYATAGQARNSFVALATDATGDGLLTVGEVLDGPALHADLVVLSACQTGLGNVAEAEGTVGLQRAFLARGARSLLVSLWSVSDEATALLMERFYAHWLSDIDAPTKSEALRRAQADVRKAPGFAEPRYWAAFQLAGGR
jgi:tetratricopeptide (TPR) repeat protein